MREKREEREKTKNRGRRERKRREKEKKERERCARIHEREISRKYLTNIQDAHKNSETVKVNIL
jgi:hypothetical protein